MWKRMWTPTEASRKEQWVSTFHISNCFGAQYLATTSSFLTLDWLHSETVQKKLERSFGVSIDGK